MQKRIVEINIGDWSDDGHGKFNTVLVELSGENVSDSVLGENYTAMATKVGVDLRNVCGAYEESSISQKLYDDLVEAGFTPQEEFDEEHAIYVAGDDDLAFDAIDLIMFYIGSAIPHFKWELIIYPTLIGGFGTIITQNEHTVSTSFGYGLYYA